jgi:acetyl esterase/lipase
MKEILGVTIEFKEIILAGHSFGGGTVAATKASLNEKSKGMVQKPHQVTIEKVICLDPWFFPLSK